MNLFIIKQKDREFVPFVINGDIYAYEIKTLRVFKVSITKIMCFKNITPQGESLEDIKKIVFNNDKLLISNVLTYSRWLDKKYSINVNTVKFKYLETSVLYCNFNNNTISFMQGNSYKFTQNFTMTHMRILSIENINL